MPRIPRWFPVSHDINGDAEVWEMRRTIGEKSLSVWLEFLSISDRNEGLLPGDQDELIRSIAGKCQATVRTVSAVYQFAISRLWLNCEATPRVSNYRKYHRPREPKLAPSEPSEPSEHRSYKNKSATPSGSASDDSSSETSESEKKRGKKMARSMNLNPEHKIQSDRLYFSDREKFKRLAVWIAQGRKFGYTEKEMELALIEFWDYRAITDWYPYLDEILLKVSKNESARKSHTEHLQHKAELQEAASNVIQLATRREG